jgi:hypothetical protein
MSGLAALGAVAGLSLLPGEVHRTADDHDVAVLLLMTLLYCCCAHGRESCFAVAQQGGVGECAAALKAVAGLSLLVEQCCC